MIIDGKGRLYYFSCSSVYSFSISGKHAEFVGRVPHAMRIGQFFADASGDDAALCASADVRKFLLDDLKKNNMVAPDWKGYEVARTLILDPEEWTTDNEMLTPSFKVKLRNLLKKHDEEIQAIG